MDNIIPKISIVVPVYNVEKYLDKCINSILNQTLSEFELILIDDGSKDSSGLICDKYAESDKRIKVIHKSNGGISSARNVGLDVAKGKYIGFVDSDDWIERDMYELLYNICEDNNCDIANCSSIIHYEQKTVINGGHSLIIHNREEAMKTMLEGTLYDEVVWTKLINREILDGIRFTEGIVYEDTYFTYRLIDKAQKVGCIGEPKYHYIKRQKGIMNLAKKDLNIDWVLIYNEMYKFFRKNYINLSELVANKLANHAMYILKNISNSYDLKKYKNKYEIVVNILNENYRVIIRLNEVNIKQKILLTFIKINPLLYIFIMHK